MRTISFYLLSIILLVAIGCQRKSAEVPAENLAPGMHAATVIEVKQTSSYTYFHAFENNQKYWMATTKLDAKEGDIIYYTNAMEMKDFKSKELNRTFETILFVNDASTEPIQLKKPVTTGKVNPKQIDGLEIDKAAGGITIAELYGDMDNLNGKEVTIRGMIVKYNRNIMGKNWAHIQDGTGHEKGFDLTVTTKDSVAEGKVATFKGKITLKKDFGYGYAYDIIMEDAKTTDVKDFEADL